jgi:hypothetical protein
MKLSRCQHVAFCREVKRLHGSKGSVAYLFLEMVPSRAYIRLQLFLGWECVQSICYDKKKAFPCAFYRVKGLPRSRVDGSKLLCVTIVPRHTRKKPCVRYRDIKKSYMHPRTTQLF